VGGGRGREKRSGMKGRGGYKRARIICIVWVRQKETVQNDWCTPHLLVPKRLQLEKEKNAEQIQG